MEKTIQNDKEITYKVARKLSCQGFNIWENDEHYQGVGFKVIFDDFWVNVWVSFNFSEPNKVYVTKHERDGNIFDCFKDKTLAKKDTQDFSTLYDLIQSIIQ